MAKLIDEAEAYQPGPKNIAELDKVPVDIDVEDEEFTFTDDQGKEKTGHNKIVYVNGDKYRVPKSVLKQLKILKEEHEDLEYIKVKKSGKGLNTDYHVLKVEGETEEKTEKVKDED